ncbi:MULTISPECIES: VOC family protein [unclassified Leucobacter]|uniref:VOC family protein n=1 Tax=unclassified Leucobacter TaxID=2621730 RepID=UPI00165E4601|nr:MULTISPECIES: VOC family protein [unclassified Leucobacter]MBC9926689.1 VOC family protein [Leucobacter sp. cx-169]MBC9935350.1 VOC family protein [Leucobacter sp. cx-87]
MSLRFNFIGIVTRDLAASLEFYRALGLDIPDGQDDADHVEIALPGGMTLAWDPIETILGFDLSYVMPAGSHRIAFAFAADSPAEVDRTVAELSAAGHKVHTEPFDAPWGQRYATLHDPDGNAVDIYALLPAD